MRNLKRVLSLALASIMLLGMMVVGASAADTKAADLKDLDDVSNKEAVSLMVDLGIIVGKPDGTFAPNETVDRATMAKLIYFILQGDADADVFKGTSGLKDVTGNWAEGFINYCYSIGIIAGDGKGNFMPSLKVTTAGAAKMILVALGFDATDRGYVNDANWSVNIMKDAQANGLLKGISQKATEDLTRDNAAQMIYNALFVRTRTPEYDRDMGEKYIKGYTVNATTLGMETYGLVKYNITIDNLDPTVTVNSVSPALADKSTNYDGAAAKKAIEKDKDLSFTADMIATNVAVYAKVTYELTSDSKGIESMKFSKLISTTLGTADTDILGTSTNGTAITGYTDGVAAPTKDLTTNKSKNKGFIAELNTDKDDNVSVTSILNGEVKASADDVDSDVADAAKLAGAVVELIDNNSDGKADIVKVTKKSVATLTANVTTRTSDDELQVKVPGVPGLSAWTAAKNVNGYEDLKKGDVVLYVKTGSDPAVYTIEKAEMVEGKVTATKGTDPQVKVDGSFYGPSGLVSNPLSGWSDTTNTYKFYLDDNGTVVKAEKVTDEAADEYAVLLASGWAGSTSDLDANSYAQAKLLFTDGTNEIVKLAKVNGTEIDNTNYDKAVVTGLKGQFVKYVINDDDKYELTTANAEDLGANIYNNTKLFDGNLIGSDDTVFLVATKDGSKTVYKTYTGIGSVPKMTGIDGYALIEKGIATTVFVDATGGTIEGIDSDALYIYVPKASDYVKYAKNGDTPAYYEYTAYVDGEKTTINLSGVLETSDAVYKLTTQNTSGHYAPTAAVTGFVTGYPIANGGTLKTAAKINGNNLFSYDDDTQIYVIADKKVTQIAVSELKADNTNDIFVVYDSNKYATVIFIRENVGSTATGTVSYTGGAEGTIDVTADGSKTIQAAKDSKISFTVETAADATYTISKSSVTVGDTAQTVTVTITSEDGETSSTYTITVEKTA